MIVYRSRGALLGVAAQLLLRRARGLHQYRQCSSVHRVGLSAVAIDYTLTSFRIAFYLRSATPQLTPCKHHAKIVEMRGVEPRTFRMQSGRATTVPHPLIFVMLLARNNHL